MGYSLHVMRERPIEEAELEPLGPVVDGGLLYRGLTLRFFQGELELKGGREADIPALLELAERLGARVQGDDGEVYPLGGVGSARAGPSLWDRAQLWLLKRIQPPPGDTPYRVGRQARDVVTGREVTIVRLEGGPLPTVVVRFADGSESKRALHGSGLDLVPE